MSSSKTSDQDAEQEIAKLEAALGGRDPQKIVKDHISLLHEYNELKDAAQLVIGKLAAMKQVTVKQLHEDYNLLPED